MFRNIKKLTPLAKATFMQPNHTRRINEALKFGGAKILEKPKINLGIKATKLLKSSAEGAAVTGATLGALGYAYDYYNAQTITSLNSADVINSKESEQVEKVLSWTLQAALENTLHLLTLVIDEYIKLVDEIINSLIAKRIECCLSTKIFSQVNFIETINQYYKKNYSSRNGEIDGFCYGLVHLWYIYRCQNKNLLEELDIIVSRLKWASPLNNFHKEILADIENLQNHQLASIYLKHANQGESAPQVRMRNNFIDHLKIFYFHHAYDIKKEEDRLPLVNKAIAAAGNNPDSLILLAIFDATHTKNHAIGITANKLGNETYVTLFDPNCGESTFANVHSAEKALLDLIASTYPETNVAFIQKKCLQEKRRLFFGKTNLK